MKPQTLLKGCMALIVVLLAGAVPAFGGDLQGRVLDAETQEPLPGANVLIRGTSFGTATGVDGHFRIAGIPAGEYTLVVRYIGFEEYVQAITVGSGVQEVTVALAPAVYSESEISIVADRARERETPVAFTNISKVQIQRQLGSRDLPLVLSTTPSVYATGQGGGAGDARINVRGFNQRNVAIMINGVPVNDMENGWVYWSNWDGVGDATSSVQLQRGLSAVNLATPSIGGTLNIITDPAAMAPGVMLKQEAGNGGFLKTTVTASTGLVNEKYALTVAGVRKVNDGLVDGTWTDAWAYYVAGSYNLNDRNRLEVYAVGAPQRHGQNLYKQNIAAYDHDYARDLFDEEVLELDEDANGTPDVFDQFKEAGRDYNENWSPVSAAYGGKQAVGSRTFSRFEKNYLNERENFYHKPQVNLNWYAQLTDRMLFSTVAYYSGGVGGGTGTAGSMVWNYDGPSRVVDYDATIARNEANQTGARGVLRNSRNNQWTIGAIAKLQYDVSEALQVRTGLDWRTAEIEHYYEVRDLLGGAYYLSTDSDFWPAEGKQLGLGDKFNYFNTNTVDWLGGFVQGEYVKDRVSVYGMGGLSGIKYTYTDHFRDDGTGKAFEAESDNILGYQVKGGGLYQVNTPLDVFANVGLVSKVPIFDGVIDDGTGIVNENPENEKFLSLEVGANYRIQSASVKLSAYATSWKDRTFTENVQLADGTEGLVFLHGVDALHQGVEMEVAYQPLSLLRFDGAASVGRWRYTDDVSGTYRSDDRTVTETYNFYLKDLKVGDAPQTQVAYGLSLFPTRGLTLQVVGKTFAEHYAEFDPLSRTDSDDRGQSWKTPAYTVLDLHLGYDVPLQARFGVRVFANVFNALDAVYVQDAVDNSSFNAFDGDGVNHRADDAEVYLGLPRTVNVGVQFRY